MLPRLQRLRNSNALAHQCKLTCALLVTGLAVSGCGRDQVSATVPLASPQVGYVYVAPLMREHPLYGQLRQLDREISALRISPRVPTPSDLPSVSLEEWMVSAPEGPPFPTALFSERRADWTLGPSLLPPASTSYLSPDLIAELRWEQRTLQRNLERSLAEARSLADTKLSELRARAVQERQERYNNAGLDLKLTDEQAQAEAEAIRLELRQEVELLMASARAETEGQLRLSREQQEKETTAKLDTVQRDIWARQQERSRIAAKSGSEIHTRMSNTLAQAEPLLFDGPLIWAPSKQGIALTGQSQGLEPKTKARLYQQARELERRRSSLAKRLYESTQAAVAGKAAIEGWVVSFPPKEPHAGSDLTETFRTMLRDLYANK